MTLEQLIADYKAMIAADKANLAETLIRGERVNAHNLVDAIIDNQRELEDLPEPK